MILIHPVYWDKVVKSTAASIPCDCPVQILYFEGGQGLLRSLTKSLKQHGISNVQCLEMGGERVLQASSRHEPVAIIGMAVNMPGAKSVDELWDILKNGSKTLRPVRPLILSGSSLTVFVDSIRPIRIFHLHDWTNSGSFNECRYR
jgi:hypothetical protein